MAHVQAYPAAEAPARPIPHLCPMAEESPREPRRPRHHARTRLAQLVHPRGVARRSGLACGTRVQQHAPASGRASVLIVAFVSFTRIPLWAGQGLIADAM